MTERDLWLENGGKTASRRHSTIIIATVDGCQRRLIQTLEERQNRLNFIAKRAPDGLPSPKRSLAVPKRSLEPQQDGLEPKQVHKSPEEIERRLIRVVPRPKSIRFPPLFIILSPNGMVCSFLIRLSAPKTRFEPCPLGARFRRLV